MRMRKKTPTFHKPRTSLAGQRRLDFILYIHSRALFLRPDNLTMRLYHLVFLCISLSCAASAMPVSAANVVLARADISTSPYYESVPFDPKQPPQHPKNLSSQIPADRLLGNKLKPLLRITIQPGLPDPPAGGHRNDTVEGFIISLLRTRGDYPTLEQREIHWIDNARSQAHWEAHENMYMHFRVEDDRQGRYCHKFCEGILDVAWSIRRDEPAGESQIATPNIDWLTY
ncbi:hypothetical protein J3R30DRAFT_1458129 [Lentinula aciculospora]|uniref:Uncharacterized protein n=1 Tax=Lentinula aciculospora TaxID=153920 RepID=A0A9W9DTL9_9AGAR|nr:hypothetical protein J3R30DRAFT_1458129 [Lentinula aciculospora]